MAVLLVGNAPISLAIAIGIGSLVLWLWHRQRSLYKVLATVLLAATIVATPSTVRGYWTWWWFLLQHFAVALRGQ
jgi:hypothetical protein